MIILRELEYVHSVAFNLSEANKLMYITVDKGEESSTLRLSKSEVKQFIDELELMRQYMVK